MKRLYSKLFLLKWLLLAVAGLAARAAESNAPVRIALMDFSTDDNSYRSAQAAIDFTRLVQIQLADLGGIDWVERARLDLARKEIGLSAMSSFDGGFGVRCGKWVKADWIITGRFSSDDRNRRTIFLEITELEHADVLASGNFETSADIASQLLSDPAIVQFVAGKLRGLLADARGRQRSVAGQIVVAPLFFAGTGHFAFSEGGSLQTGFSEALERAAATNSRIRLIHFPKAYQAIEESEMILDGLVDAKPGTWQPLADLFVWGTYAVTNIRISGKFETKYVVNLSAWDGSSPPLVMSETLDTSFRQAVPAADASRMLDRMAGRIIGQAQKQKPSPDSSAVRHQIADSIVKTYLATRERGGGMDEGQALLDSVHMLETACFFDPGSSNAQLLRITARWGRWMDFSFHVKNEFWSKWRRSQAWGKYVDRFGLAPVEIKLPFPDNTRQLPQKYLSSLDDVIRQCPYSFDSSEDEEYGAMKEAQRHGFPKEISNATAAEWKAGLETEYWERLKRVIDFAVSDERVPQQFESMPLFSTIVRGLLHGKQPPAERLALLEKVWPVCVAHSKKFGRRWIVGGDDETELTALCAAAGRPDQGARLLGLLSTTPIIYSTNPPAISGIRSNSWTNAPFRPGGPFPPFALRNPGFGPMGGQSSAVQRPVSIRMVPAPAWYKQIKPNFRIFDLYPPSVLPREVKPDRQEYAFPAQFEVKLVTQLEMLRDTLLILAIDERSTPSGDATPDVSAEAVRKRGRLWSVGPGDSAPRLFEERALPADIRSVLPDKNQLWVAGQSFGYLDLSNHTFRTFGLHDGLSAARPGALAAAAGDIFAGEYLHLFRFERQNSRWKEISLPFGNFSSPCFLVGNSRSLVLIAGFAHVYNPADALWTHLPAMQDYFHNNDERMALLAEDNGFWFGTDSGLYFYSTSNQAFRSWRAPVSVQSFANLLMGGGLMGGDSVTETALDGVDERLQAGLQTVRKRGAEAAAKFKEKSEANPLEVNWRIPGDTTALAGDGDFLWIGAENYFGHYLVLLHKPTESLVSYASFRERISSLAVSGNSVWAGLAWGDQKLVRLSKDAFVSVPSRDWVRVAISPEERMRLVRTMKVRDQAMYAFYAGDSSRVVELLGNANPEKATLEEMFLLAFSYGTGGLDRPDQARVWFDRIISRYPDSPWARTAKQTLADNDQRQAAQKREADLLRRFDRNRDGALDNAERSVMEADPAYQREEAAAKAAQLDAQADAILQRYDSNRDEKLDRTELSTLKNLVLAYAQAPPEVMAGRTPALAPLINPDFPSETEILKKHDANADGALDGIEWKKFVRSRFRQN